MAMTWGRTNTVQLGWVARNMVMIGGQISSVQLGCVARNVNMVGCRVNTVQLGSVARNVTMIWGCMNTVQPSFGTRNLAMHNFRSHKHWSSNECSCVFSWCTKVSKNHYCRKYWIHIHTYTKLRCLIDLFLPCINPIPLISKALQNHWLLLVVSIKLAAVKTIKCLL